METIRSISAKLAAHAELCLAGLIILLSVLGCGKPVTVTATSQPTIQIFTDAPVVPITTQASQPTIYVQIPTHTQTSYTPSPGPSLTPTTDTRLTAYYWREWQTVPALSLSAQNILITALSNPDLDPHTFSKVGDCQMTSDTFLGGYATGAYRIPAGMEATVQWFSTSLTSESITAANGLGINSILNPLFGRAAGYKECETNETPLDCELRTKRPTVVLIAMGTNWKPNGELGFDKHLRVVIDRVLETGALPILATKGDNIEGDWKLNQVIAQAAYEYDLPLVNVWRTVQGLPNHGLQSPKNIYLTGDAWMLRNEAWLKTLDEVRDILDQ